MSRSNLWLGTEDSFLQVLTAQKYALEHPDLAMSAQASAAVSIDDDEEEQPDSHLIQREGSVALLTIDGPLVAQDSWYNQLFGLISYQDIIRAAQQLALDDGITHVVLNMDTPGGDVAGLDSASEALKWLAGIKPVHAHVAGHAFSAGYWLASVAKKITATKMSEVGSIGVLLVHRSVYRALEEDGIDYTIIRAGKYKALGHPAEKLSDEAKVILEEKAQTLYSFFLEHVSSHRPSLRLSTKDSWAEGKTFFAEQGLELGMVDSLMSLSAVVNKLGSAKPKASRSSIGSFSNEVNDMSKKKQVVLPSEQARAALESGAALEELEAQAAESEAAGDSASQADTASLEGIDTSAESSDGTADGAGDRASAGAGTQEAAAQAPTDQTGVVAFLKEQNADLGKQVATLTAKLESADTRYDALAADLDGLTDIAVRSIHNMQIALHADPIDLKGLPASTVIAQHTKVRTAFEAAFKVGQQSRTVAADPQEDDQAPALRFGIVPKK